MTADLGSSKKTTTDPYSATKTPMSGTLKKKNTMPVTSIDPFAGTKNTNAPIGGFKNSTTPTGAMKKTNQFGSTNPTKGMQ